MVYDRDFKGWENQTYQCARPTCRHVFSGKKLAERGRMICPKCGYRVIEKVRNPIVRRVKAR